MALRCVVYMRETKKKQTIDKVEISLHWQKRVVVLVERYTFTHKQNVIHASDHFFASGTVPTLLKHKCPTNKHTYTGLSAVIKGTKDRVLDVLLSKLHNGRSIVR